MGKGARAAGISRRREGTASVECMTVWWRPRADVTRLSLSRGWYHLGRSGNGLPKGLVVSRAAVSACIRVTVRGVRV